MASKNPGSVAEMLAELRRRMAQENPRTDEEIGDDNEPEQEN